MLNWCSHQIFLSQLITLKGILRQIPHNSQNSSKHCSYIIWLNLIAHCSLFIADPTLLYWWPENARVLSPDKNRTWKMSENSTLPLAAVEWGNGLLQSSAGRWLYQKSSTSGESWELFLLLQWKSLWWWWWLSFQRSPSRNCLFPLDGFTP